MRRPRPVHSNDDATSNTHVCGMAHTDHVFITTNQESTARSQNERTQREWNVSREVSSVEHRSLKKIHAMQTFLIDLAVLHVPKAASSTSELGDQDKTALDKPGDKEAEARSSRRAHRLV